MKLITQRLSFVVSGGCIGTAIGQDAGVIVYGCSCIIVACQRIGAASARDVFTRTVIASCIRVKVACVGIDTPIRQEA